MRGSEPMPWRTCSISAPSALGQIGDLAHEADLGGEHGVGGVFRELGGAHIHEHQLVVIAVVGSVAFAHQLAHAYRTAVPTTMRAGLVKSSTALPSLRNSGLEQTSNGNVEPRLACSAAIWSAHHVAGADRHGRFVDDHLVAVDVGADRPGDIEHVGKVGRTVLVRRRSDADEDDTAGSYGSRGIGGEGQPALVEIARDHGFQPRLENRDDAEFQSLDLIAVDIDADHLMADVGEAGASHQANIARPKNSDFHCGLS